MEEVTCSELGCTELATHNDPLELCTDHYDRWELLEAQEAADNASERLAQVQKRLQRRKRYSEPLVMYETNKRRMK